MSMLFGNNDSPVVQPVPRSPATSVAAEKRRQDAARAAQAEAAGAGRASTVYAGRTIAEEKQYKRALAAKNSGAASDDMQL